MLPVVFAVESGRCRESLLYLLCITGEHRVAGSVRGDLFVPGGGSDLHEAGGHTDRARLPLLGHSRLHRRCQVEAEAAVLPPLHGSVSPGSGLPCSELPYNYLTHKPMFQDFLILQEFVQNFLVVDPVQPRKSLSSPPELEFRPPLPITIPVVADLVFYCLFMYVNEWWGKKPPPE